MNIEDETYNEHRDDLSNFIDEDEGYAYAEEDYDGIDDDDDYDYDFDDAMNEIDFSEFSGGNFKRTFSKVKNQMGTRLSGVIVPQERKVIVEGQGEEEQADYRPKRVPTYRKRRPMSDGTKLSGVVVPQERKVIVEGQSEEDEDFFVPRRKIRKKLSRPVAERVRRKKMTIAKQRRKQKPAPIRRKKRYDADVQVERGTVNLKGKRGKKISDVIVPTDRKVIVKGASDFIVSQNNDAIKNIGYYKGKKLQELVLTFNNNSAVDFDMQVFNPSMPLDYLYSTAQNLNDKVQIAGGEVSYTDVLFNLLANPTFIPNAKFVFSGPSVTQQKSQPLKVINQNIAGKVKIAPLNLDLQIDTMQVASDMVYFEFNDVLNRPYIPDGMDIITYKILAGNTVTMAFFYKQVNLKKVFYKQANRKGLL